jgi:hypothetical protein
MTFCHAKVFENVAIRRGLFFDREDSGVGVDEVWFLAFVVAALELEG